MKKVLITTKKGRCIKMNAKDLPTQLRGGMGIKAVTLRIDDEVISVITYEAPEVQEEEQETEGEL